MSLRKSFELALSNILFDKVRSFLTMLWISSRACSFVVIVSITYLRSPAAPEEMAQPRRDFPPGKALYMGGRRDLSPTAGQTPPERRQGEALRRSVFSPRRLHPSRRSSAVRRRNIARG